MKMNKPLSVFLFVLVLSLPLQARSWNVIEEGAVADGETDCTSVFQSLLDEAGKAGGGIVHVPSGRYFFEGTLAIPAGVTLEGTFQVPPTRSHWGDLRPIGSILLATAGRGDREAPPFIRLAGHAATLKGLIIEYPEWSREDIPPIPYPPCIKGETYNNLGVVDCLLLNPYEGMVFSWGRVYVRNVYGYPIYRGLYIDRCLDVGRVENVHFWPFGIAYDPGDPYCRWINENGVAFEFGRTDWQYVLNTFCFGYGVGYKFSESGHGHCHGNFVGIGADCCRRPILVEQCGKDGLLITNGQFVGRWTSNDSVGLEIGEACTGRVSLSNCTFFGTLDRAIWQRGPNSSLSVIGTHFDRWDINANGVGAVHLDAGKAIVQGNVFSDSKLPVFVGAEVKSAILMGNQAVSGFRVENLAGDRTEILGNERYSVKWPESGLSHYRVGIGIEGDDLYLRKWHRAELHSGQSMRWSGNGSEMILPVLPDTLYTVSMDIQVPEQALVEEAGVFLGEERLIALTSVEHNPLEFTLPPQPQSPVLLVLRCGSWVPRELNPNSRDSRPLGIVVRSITLRAEGAEGEVFDANGG